jgi:peptide/nickel transport system substrate-binding protein
LRRAVLIVLSALILFGTASCAKIGESNQPTTVLTAPKTTEKNSLGRGLLQLYFSSSDSLNPYKSQTNGNRRLATLMFDSLTKLSPDLNPVLSLAKTVSVSGRSVTVVLNDAVFSDGSTVTAEDVTYSLSLAKSSKTAGFREQLSEISGYSAANSYTVSLNLNKYDPQVAAILDFPIIKG